ITRAMPASRSAARVVIGVEFTMDSRLLRGSSECKPRRRDPARAPGFGVCSSRSPHLEAVMKRFVIFAIACGALACSTVPRPVPVAGTPAGLSALAGQWNGEYHANGGGRQGTVVFKLAAGADTASGEVLMFPRELATDSPNGGPNRRPLPQSLA